MVAGQAVERSALEPAVGPDHPQPGRGAERAPLVGRAPLETHLDDLPAMSHGEVDRPLRRVPARALPDALLAFDPAIVCLPHVRCRGFEDVEHQLTLRGEELARASQRAQPLGIADEVEIRPERHEHARRGSERAGRVCEVAERQRDALGDAGALGARAGERQHGGRCVETADVVPGKRERYRDAARAASELDDGSLDARADSDVELEVLDDALAPHVVERAESLVGIAAGRGQLGSRHTRRLGAFGAHAASLCRPALTRTSRRGAVPTGSGAETESPRGEQSAEVHPPSRSGRRRTGAKREAAARRGAGKQGGTAGADQASSLREGAE